MTLILVKNKTVLDLPSLLRLVLKKIYEPSKTTNQEHELIMQGIVGWKNHLDTARETGFGVVDEENQIALEYIGKILEDDAEGKLERRKELFIKHGIDYKKFYRLPGSWLPEDFVKAQYFHKQLPKDEQ